MRTAARDRSYVHIRIHHPGTTAVRGAVTRAARRCRVPRARRVVEWAIPIFFHSSPLHSFCLYLTCPGRPVRRRNQYGCVRVCTSPESISTYVGAHFWRINNRTAARWPYVRVPRRRRPIPRRTPRKQIRGSVFPFSS
jgi:hypothetical protein